jgi:hypothetical protein
LMPSYDEYLKFIKSLETELITEYFWRYWYNSWRTLGRFIWSRNAIWTN